MTKPLVLVAAIVGVLLLGIAVYYWVTPAGSLLPFLPGYEHGVAAHHVKYSIVATVLALALFALAWFWSKPVNR